MARIAPCASKRVARSRGLPPACRWTCGPKYAGKQSMCTCRQRAKSRRIESLTGHSAGRESRARWGGGALFLRRRTGVFSHNIRPAPHREPIGRGSWDIWEKSPSVHQDNIAIFRQPIQPLASRLGFGNQFGYGKRIQYVFIIRFEHHFRRLRSGDRSREGSDRSGQRMPLGDSF
jgi:hypothetical protein